MCPYSIGDILLTVSNQNPAVKWVGTTWTKIEGRFLLGTSSSYSVGATAGSATSILTVANLPSHTHNATQSAHIHTQPAHSHVVTSYEGGGDQEFQIIMQDITRLEHKQLQVQEEITQEVLNPQ